jgi:hypothetical protein
MKVKLQDAYERGKTYSAFYRKGIVRDRKKALNPVQKYLLDHVTGDLSNELGYAEHG